MVPWPGLEGSVVVNEVRSAKKGWGLNVDTGETVDLVKAGIIDPAMVTRSALQNAASIAKNILTTEAVVAEAPEKPAELSEEEKIALIKDNFDATEVVPDDDARESEAG